MIFHELNVGDKFEAGGDTCIKIKNTRYSDKPLSRRETNAVNLRNGHELVIGENVKVILIEEVTK